MAQPPDGAEALAEELRVAVGRFVRATRARADVAPRAHVEALAHLEGSGPQTIAQLAAARGVRHQGMSRTVAELERAGAVVRAANPHDARGWVISLTAAGAASRRADRAARRDVLARRIREELDDEGRRLLQAVPGLLGRLTG